LELYVKKKVTEINPQMSLELQKLDPVMTKTTEISIKARNLYDIVRDSHMRNYRTNDEETLRLLKDEMDKMDTNLKKYDSSKIMKFDDDNELKSIISTYEQEVSKSDEIIKSLEKDIILVTTTQYSDVIKTNTCNKSNCKKQLIMLTDEDLCYCTSHDEEHIFWFSKYYKLWVPYNIENEYVKSYYIYKTFNAMFKIKKSELKVTLNQLDCLYYIVLNSTYNFQDISTRAIKDLLDIFQDKMIKYYKMYREKEKLSTSETVKLYKSYFKLEDDYKRHHDSFNVIIKKVKDHQTIKDYQAKLVVGKCPVCNKTNLTNIEQGLDRTCLNNKCGRVFYFTGILSLRYLLKEGVSDKVSYDNIPKIIFGRYVRYAYMDTLRNEFPSDLTGKLIHPDFIKRSYFNYNFDTLPRYILNEFNDKKQAYRFWYECYKDIEEYKKDFPLNDKVITVIETQHEELLKKGLIDNSLDDIKEYDFTKLYYQTKVEKNIVRLSGSSTLCRSIILHGNMNKNFKDFTDFIFNNFSTIKYVNPLYIEDSYFKHKEIQDYFNSFYDDRLFFHVPIDDTKHESDIQLKRIRNIHERLRKYCLFETFEKTAVFEFAKQNPNMFYSYGIWRNGLYFDDLNLDYKGTVEEYLDENIFDINNNYFINPHDLTTNHIEGCLKSPLTICFQQKNYVPLIFIELEDIPNDTPEKTKNDLINTINELKRKYKIGKKNIKDIDNYMRNNPNKFIKIPNQQAINIPDTRVVLSMQKKTGILRGICPECDKLLLVVGLVRYCIDPMCKSYNQEYEYDSKLNELYQSDKTTKIPYQPFDNIYIYNFIFIHKLVQYEMNILKSNLKDVPKLYTELEKVIQDNIEEKEEIIEEIKNMDEIQQKIDTIFQLEFEVKNYNYTSLIKSFDELYYKLNPDLASIISLPQNEPKNKNLNEDIKKGVCPYCRRHLLIIDGNRTCINIYPGCISYEYISTDGMTFVTKDKISKNVYEDFINIKTNEKSLKKQVEYVIAQFDILLEELNKMNRIDDAIITKKITENIKKITSDKEIYTKELNPQKYNRLLRNVAETMNNHVNDVNRINVSINDSIREKDTKTLTDLNKLIKDIGEYCVDIDLIIKTHSALRDKDIDTILGKINEIGVKNKEILKKLTEERKNKRFVIKPYNKDFEDDKTKLENMKRELRKVSVDKENKKRELIENYKNTQSIITKNNCLFCNKMGLVDVTTTKICYFCGRKYTKTILDSNTYWHVDPTINNETCRKSNLESLSKLNIKTYDCAGRKITGPEHEIKILNLEGRLNRNYYLINPDFITQENIANNSNFERFLGSLNSENDEDVLRLWHFTLTQFNNVKNDIKEPKIKTLLTNCINKLKQFNVIEDDNDKVNIENHYKQFTNNFVIQLVSVRYVLYSKGQISTADVFKHIKNYFFDPVSFQNKTMKYNSNFVDYVCNLTIEEEVYRFYFIKKSCLRDIITKKEVSNVLINKLQIVVNKMEEIGILDIFDETLCRQYIVNQADEFISSEIKLKEMYFSNYNNNKIQEIINELCDNKNDYFIHPDDITDANLRSSFRYKLQEIISNKEYLKFIYIKPEKIKSLSKNDLHLNMFAKIYLWYVLHQLRTIYGLLSCYEDSDKIIKQDGERSKEFLKITDYNYKFYPLDDIHKIYKISIEDYKTCPNCYGKLTRNSNIQYTCQQCANIYVCSKTTSEYILDPNPNSSIKNTSPITIKPNSSRYPGKKSEFNIIMDHIKDTTRYYLINPGDITLEILNVNPQFMTDLKTYTSDFKYIHYFLLFTDNHIKKIQCLKYTKHNALMMKITNIYLHLRYNGLIDNSVDNVVIREDDLYIKTIEERRFAIKGNDHGIVFKTSKANGKFLNRACLNIKITDRFKDNIIKIADPFQILYVPVEDIISTESAQVRNKLMDLHKDLLNEGYIEMFESDISNKIRLDTNIIYQNGLYFDSLKTTSGNVTKYLEFRKFIHPNELEDKELNTGNNTKDDLLPFLFIYGSLDIEIIKTKYLNLLKNLYNLYGLLDVVNMNDLYHFIENHSLQFVNKPVIVEQLNSLEYPSRSIGQLKGVISQVNYTEYGNNVLASNPLRIYMYNIIAETTIPNRTIAKENIDVVLSNIAKDDFHYLSLSKEGFLDALKDNTLECACLYYLITRFLYSIGYRVYSNILPGKKFDIKTSLFPISNEEYETIELDEVYKIVLNDYFYWFKYVDTTNIYINTDGEKSVNNHIAIAKMAKLIYEANKITFSIKEADFHSNWSFGYTIKGEKICFNLNSTYPLHTVIYERLEIFNHMISMYNGQNINEYIKKDLIKWGPEPYLFLDPSEQVPQELFKIYGVCKIKNIDDQTILPENTLKSDKFYCFRAVKNYKQYINNPKYRTLFYDIAAYFNSNCMLLNYKEIIGLFANKYLKNSINVDEIKTKINIAINNNDLAYFWKFERYMLPFIDIDISLKLGPMIDELDKIRCKINSLNELYPLYDKMPQITLTADINNINEFFIRILSILHINIIKNYTDIFKLKQSPDVLDLPLISSYTPEYKKMLFFYIYNLINRNKLTIDNAGIISNPNKIKGGDNYSVNLLELLTKFINLKIFQRE
jgi:hypothetical protein